MFSNDLNQFFSFCNVFLKQIEDGCRPTLAFAGISGLKSALGDAYAAVFSNEKTNDQAAEQLVKDLDQLLEDYN